MIVVNCFTYFTIIAGQRKNTGKDKLLDMFFREYQRGKYHCTADLLFDWFGISFMTTDIACFYLQNRQIQTSQTGGQWCSDTSPFSIPWLWAKVNIALSGVLVSE
jgi:hypothetical protein